MTGPETFLGSVLLITGGLTVFSLLLSAYFSYREAQKYKKIIDLYEKRLTPHERAGKLYNMEAYRRGRIEK